MTTRPAELNIVQVDGWKRYSWLRHGFSTRAGGVSSVYGGDALNLGWTKEDSSSSVAENRRRFTHAIAGDDTKADPLVSLRQIHSRIVHQITCEDGALDGKLSTPEGKAVLEGDGLMTDLPGVLLGVGTADCVPVLVVDVRRRAVAAFHAGWRGTVAGIVRDGVEQMVFAYGSQPEDLIAAVGPSIGLCCYSVGEEVRTEFGSKFAYAEELFRNRSQPEASSTIDSETENANVKLYLDLWQANRQQLLDAGLKDEQITVVGECTACTREQNGTRRYFSHRVEHGVTGRMLSAVGIARGHRIVR